MGYYSTLEGEHRFRTWCKDGSDIEKVFEETFAGHADKLTKPEDLGYDFVLRSEDGKNWICIESDEYTSKHWFEREIVLFIQKLIAPDARTYLLFVGEDNLRWGYAITAQQIFNIEFVELVGGRPLEAWLAGG